MATRRSTGLIALGAVVLVASVGLGAAALATGADEAPATTDPAAAEHSDETPRDVPRDAAQDEAGDERLPLPDDAQAVALTLGRTEGLAGHLRAGDRVDVHGVIRDHPDGDDVARRALDDVEVLAVSGGEGEVTVLLALTAEEVETAVFLSAFESVWLSLVGDGDQPADTPGATYHDLWQQP